MNKQTWSAISIIADEANYLREVAEGYYDLNNQANQNMEQPIINFETPNTHNIYTKWLRFLHAPLNNLDFKLNDDERHYLFSKVFGRHIRSAKEVTNIESWAWNKFVEKNPPLATAMIKDILRERHTSG